MALATPRDRPAVVATFVAAFARDPAVRFFLYDDATYGHDAAVVGGHLFDRRVTDGSVWIAGNGASVAMWDKPDRTEPEEVPLSLSDESLARWKAYGAAVHEHLPPEPHWYLGVLATHPDYAGRRLGRALLTTGLAEASRAGVPAVLETSTEANVELYRRSGFDVHASFTLDAVPVWVMVQPAR